MITNKKLLSALLGLNLVTFIAAVGIIQLGVKKQNQAALDSIADLNSLSEHHEDPTEHDGSSGAFTVKNPKIFTVGDFTANLRGLKNFVKVNVSVEPGVGMKQDELKDRAPQVRDKIIYLLNDETAENLQTVAGRKRLSEMITQELSKIIKSGPIAKTYFSTFVIQ
jgi:flagellar basal body-associated protein FliL